MAQGDGLGEVLVEAQGPGDGAGDLVDLQRVGQAGAVVVAFGRQEHLGLLFETPEGFAVDDAVPVPLIAGAQGAFLFRHKAAAALAAFGRPGRKNLVFHLFGVFPSSAGHG